MRSLFAALILCMTSTPGSVAQTLTLKGGVPEGLPGYAMGMDGSLTIEVPLKKRIFQCIEKALDARVVWEAYPTRRVVQMLIDGKLDLAFPMGFTSERASKMLQSRPTWENPDNWLSMRPLDITDKSLRIAARLGSPQQVDYLADGYTHVVGTYTYEELVRTLVQGLADAVIVPQSVYEDMKADWPKETRVSVGRARNSGFYLNAADPKNFDLYDSKSHYLLENLPHGADHAYSNTQRRKLPCATYKSESVWKWLKRKTLLQQVTILKEWMMAHLA